MALRMSAMGQKQTFSDHPQNVRFRVQSGHYSYRRRTTHRGITGTSQPPARRPAQRPALSNNMRPVKIVLLRYLASPLAGAIEPIYRSPVQRPRRVRMKWPADIVRLRDLASPLVGSSEPTVRHPAQRLLQICMKGPAHIGSQRYLATPLPPPPHSRIGVCPPEKVGQNL